MPPIFRRCTPADVSACLALFDGNTPRFFDQSERPLFGAFLNGGPVSYFVLEDLGRVVACGGLALFPDASAGVPLSPDSAGLNWGMVEQAQQRRGLGTQLVQKRLAWLHAHYPAISEVRLVTSQLSSAFYARLGFQVSSVTPNGFAPGLDEVQMVRLLDPVLP